MRKMEKLKEMKEELKREIVIEVLETLRCELEEDFREDFVDRVKRAELRVKEGKVSRYTPEEFKKAFSWAQVTSSRTKTFA